MIAAGLLLGLLPHAAQSADELWDRGERAAAIEAMLAELSARGDDAGFRRTLVERELAVHRYAAALEHLEPLGDELDAERGYCLYRLGRFEEAVRYLDPTRRNHALLIFDTLEALGRHAEAADALARAAEILGADEPRVLARVGKTRAREGDHAAAVKAFRAALDADPLLMEALFGLGRALLRTGEREEGLRVLARHRALVPLVDELDFARDGLDLNPLHGPNHARVGDAERRLGLLDRAEASYARAAQLAKPEEAAPIALRHARLLDEDRGDPKAAVSVLELAYHRVRDARLAVRAAAVLLAAKDARGAVEWLEEAKRVRPNDAEIQRRLEEARAAVEAGG